MSKRATTPEVLRRVDEILRIRLDGAEFWDVREYVRGKEVEAGSPWQLKDGEKPMSEGNLWRYVAKADQAMEESASRSRKKLIRSHAAKRRNLYAKAVLSADYRTALACLRDHASAAGTSLLRQACKMATGSGKTVVMGMLIAWHTLNKVANPTDRRFSDSFLIVAPGITIRDRLRVLLPSDPGNYYEFLDIVPGDMRAALGQAKIVITNYYAFKWRDLATRARAGSSRGC